MLTQLIYASQPFGYDGATLSNILNIARRKNPQYGVTGALICRPDLYLQLIEGETAEIDRLYTRIVADDRHLEVTTLSRAAVTERMFPDWAMLHDPAQSWLWSPDEVWDGALRKASQSDLRAVFTRVKAEAPRN